eukprot:1798229-Alexandrium_andersonii.AAC.1
MLDDQHAAPGTQPDLEDAYAFGSAAVPDASPPDARQPLEEVSLPRRGPGVPGMEKVEALLRPEPAGGQPAGRGA